MVVSRDANVKWPASDARVFSLSWRSDVVGGRVCSHRTAMESTRSLMILLPRKAVTALGVMGRASNGGESCAQPTGHAQMFQKMFQNLEPFTPPKTARRNFSAVQSRRAKRSLKPTPDQMCYGRPSSRSQSGQGSADMLRVPRRIKLWPRKL